MSTNRAVQETPLISQEENRIWQLYVKIQLKKHIFESKVYLTMNRHQNINVRNFFSCVLSHSFETIVMIYFSYCAGFFRRA